MGKQDGQREVLWGFIRSIAKHDALVASAQLLEWLLVVEALSNVWRLLFNGDKQVQRLIVEALLGAVVADGC